MSSGLLSPILLTRGLLVGLPMGFPTGEFSFPLKRCEMRGCCPTFYVEALASSDVAYFLTSFLEETLPAVSVSAVSV